MQKYCARTFGLSNPSRKTPWLNSAEIKTEFLQSRRDWKRVFGSATTAIPREDVGGQARWVAGGEVVLRDGGGNRDRWRGRGRQNAPWFCDPLTRSITLPPGSLTFLTREIRVCMTSLTSFRLSAQSQRSSATSKCFDRVTPNDRWTKACANKCTLDKTAIVNSKCRDWFSIGRPATSRGFDGIYWPRTLRWKKSGLENQIADSSRIAKRLLHTWVDVRFLFSSTLR